MQSAAQDEVKVWDGFVRLFHWATVALFALAFATAESSETIHQYAGYAVLALATARIVWGFVGPGPARFAAFVKGPRAVLAYLGAVARRQAPRHLGHNPAGGAMIAALLTSLLVVGATGVLQTLDGWSEAEWVEEVHEFAANGMLALIALHLIGVLVSSLEHGENLVRAMITGRKRRAAARPDRASGANVPSHASAREQLP